MKYEEWQFEFMYFQNPDVSSVSENSPQVMKKMKETDFESEAAVNFKSGWDAASHIAIRNIKKALFDAGIKE